ncbi:MAG: hypothetical protein ACI8Q1_000675 [Parvicella sp.]|jgi:hypothetical protein
MFLSQGKYSSKDKNLNQLEVGSWKLEKFKTEFERLSSSGVY